MDDEPIKSGYAIHYELDVAVGNNVPIQVKKLWVDLEWLKNRIKEQRQNFSLDVPNETYEGYMDGIEFVVLLLDEEENKRLKKQKGNHSE